MDIDMKFDKKLDKMEKFKTEKLDKHDKKEKKDKLAFETKKGKKDKVMIDGLAKGDKGALNDFLSGKQKKSKEKGSKQFKKKQKDTAKTRAARAGLHFPVARIHSKLKNIVPARSRVGGTAAVFMAAVIEYLVAELCELAGNRAKGSSRRVADGPDDKKRRARITPRYIQFAIHEDGEFAQLLSKTWLTGGGVVPLDDKKLKAQVHANKQKKMLQSYAAGEEESGDESVDEMEE